MIDEPPLRVETGSSIDYENEFTSQPDGKTVKGQNQLWINNGLQ
jgi:hypothetical protein